LITSDIYFAILGLELGLHLEPALFVMGFVEIGSHELFAQARFKL
jgi:hypothetical protein